MSYSVAVAGASGYAGGELLRLLAAHPEFDVTTVTAHSNAGEKLGTVHPHLRSYAEMTLAVTSAKALAGHDVVFLALPHGASGPLTADLPAEALVIDCGADHRLTDKADWDAYYSGAFSEPWAYGIPELPVAGAPDGKQRANLVGARRIAAPGCNASAVTLAIAPGLAARTLRAAGVTATLAVGPSGAGKAARVDLLASEILGSANPYAVGNKHRHIPEILQNMRLAIGTLPAEVVLDAGEPSLTMTPVIVPMARGILAVVTAQTTPHVTWNDLYNPYAALFADEPFVDVLPYGEFPRSGDATGANTCLIGMSLDEATGLATIITALDNLVKGTAGAAIQSANVALGLPETMGLVVDGVAP